MEGQNHKSATLVVQQQHKYKSKAPHSNLISTRAVQKKAHNEKEWCSATLDVYLSV
jgi:hypothetical protein